MPSSRAFDFDAMLALWRLSDLAVAPDGSRLTLSVTRTAEEGKAFESSVWEVDPAGQRPPRRLTRWANGARSARFAPDGSLLFLAPGEGEDAPSSRLLQLPPGPGEAEEVAAPPAGVSAFRVAAASGRVVLGTSLHPGTSTWEEDEEHDKRRADARVTAQLHEDYPVRYWDRWLGPRERHLFAQGQEAFRHLTSGAGFTLETGAFDVAPAGDAVAMTWSGRPEDPRDEHAMLVVVPVAESGEGGERRVLLDEPRVSYGAPAWSPDGRRIACIRHRTGSPERCTDMTLAVVDAETASWKDVLEGFDRWPQSVVWAPDGASLYLTADDDGRVLPFRVDLDSGRITRLATEGAYSDLVVAPDGSVVYALRAGIGEPPHPVALDPQAADQEPRRIPAPTVDGEAGEPAFARHRVERVETRAADGTRVPGWLVLPREGEGDGPPPLAVFIHGGPLGSWNTWHWRWNPHLLAARGWAVLLPDPALSTGYGLEYVQRGWGRWGAEPYTDLMALVEAVCARDDVDGTRTAAMGGSFGGYMANWVAGHTERFDAIVTHASLWHLEGFHGVTDSGPAWENEFGDRYTEPERYREWSPHLFVDRIRTPMLVIHGERDFRVPVSESLALWTDLRRHGVTSAFLRFPDENHWVLSPPHSRLWYETVFAWLDHHVLGKPWQRPPDL